MPTRRDLFALPLALAAGGAEATPGREQWQGRHRRHDDRRVEPSRRSRRPGRPTRPNDPNRPHVVLVVLDDADDDTMATAMPKTQRLLASRGATYPNHICENPVCGPARATLLTGRRSDRTGILTNDDAARGIAGPTLPKALNGRGYQTALIGKYLNGYRGPRPAGWDAFDTRDIGNTDGIARRAVRWLVEHPSGPVFLYLAPMSPHVGGTVPTRYQDAYPEAPEPQRTWLRRARAVDDLVGAVAARLDVQRRLQRTVFVVVSDNGYHLFGEHGVANSKGTPYREATQVRMWMMGPGFPGGTVDDRLTAPQDIAVTVAAVTGATLASADGINLLAERREHLLMQFHQSALNGPFGPWRALRFPEATYVEWSDGRPPSWFDHAQDPTEETDFYDSLSDARKDDLAALLAEVAG